MAEKAAKPVVLTEEHISQKVDVVGYGLGILRFVGLHKAKGTARCGVELFEPVGNNNGSAGGQFYFSCPDKHGVLVVPSKVHSSVARAKVTQL